MLPFQKNKSLKSLTTLGIGGLASYYLEIHSPEEMQKAICACQTAQLDYFILGKGSNCLFDDLGFEGAILHNKIDFFKELTPGIFHVGAGYSFSLLGTQTARLNWSGLEFASGIPASVGGAVFMNAGANGGETFDTLTSVDYIDENGIFKQLPKDSLTFGYRSSSFQNIKGAIVGATFSLQPSMQARERQLEIIRYRQKTQPYKDRTAGCIFRNPSSDSAGKLIEMAGLKGFGIGGAKVSEMHANFLVNADAATSQSFLELIAFVRQAVEEKTGIRLESEVRHVPNRFSS